MRIYGFAVAAAGLLFAVPAGAADRCAALVAKQNSVTRATDAARIKRSDASASVGAADIGKVMVEGPWRVVWATPKNAERGVYFFRRGAKGLYRLAGTWGGVLAPGERQDGIKWASAIKGGGPSPRLARCFADAVIAGE
jgi:hypothetical protein